MFKHFKMGKKTFCPKQKKFFLLYLCSPQKLNNIVRKLQFQCNLPSFVKDRKLFAEAGSKSAYSLLLPFFPSAVGSLNCTMFS